MEQNPTQKKNKKKGNKKLRTILTMAALAIVIAGAAVAYSVLSARSTADGMLYVRAEMTKQDVADSLNVHFGKKFADKVMLLTTYRDFEPARRSGAYRITKGMTAVEAWRMLVSGRQTPVKFTFNNLRTLDDFAQTADRQLAMSKEDILKFLTDSTHCANLGFNPQTIPAMLIPDTYEVYWAIKPEDLLKKMKGNFDNYWTETRVNQAEKLGLSPVDVATLASIVEEETAAKDERGTVARLYLNRLHKGMPLQSDPTVKFAIGDETLRRITLEHLKTESPYNTYIHQGLPPGPIRLPEKSTLTAILNAPEHDYIYMCAKEDFSGRHNFTNNYATHINNAHRYQAELNRRGIK